MTLDEWKNSDEWNMPLWKFLRCTHYYTERVGIYVVSGGNWQPGERDFWLSKNVFKGIRAGQYQAELERLLRYYADVPVWNVCAEWTNDGLRADGNGQSAVTWLTARCHYYDIRDGLALEKADIKKAKRKEYAKKRKEQKADD